MNRYALKNEDPLCAEGFEQSRHALSRYILSSAREAELASPNARLARRSLTGLR